MKRTSESFFLNVSLHFPWLFQWFSGMFLDFFNVILHVHRFLRTNIMRVVESIPKIKQIPGRPEVEGVMEWFQKVCAEPTGSTWKVGWTGFSWVFQVFLHVPCLFQCYSRFSFAFLKDFLHVDFLFKLSCIFIGIDSY